MDIHDIKKKGGTLLFSYNKISFSYKKQKNKVENDIILSKNVGGNYMSKLQEMRYKEVKPEETVARLKKILEENNIEVEEQWREKSSAGTYSLRLCIKGTNIGQNGKGMTKEFAAASAYSEFFERYQNGILKFRIEKPTKEIPFMAAPDEKNMNAEELEKEDNAFFNNIIARNNIANATDNEKVKLLQKILNETSNIIEPEKEHLVLPYYSVKSKKMVHIPYKLNSYLYDTNGMCAGNSPEEALIEGLSEILERYVALKIFKEKVTLPEIPNSYLEKYPKVKKMMDKFANDEEYIFKLIDCTFGGKYPVAGLYIIQKNTGKFGFKLGAHPDYGIAMERCFTEAAQGRDIYEYSQTCMFDFDDEKVDKNSNMIDFLFSDLSTMPYQLIGEKPKYDFTSIEDISELNNKQILKRLVNSIINDGFDILIRDVSVFGFPSYSIIIPGMSEVTFDPDASRFNKFSTMQKLLMDFNNINLSNIDEVTKIMETIVKEVGYEKISILLSLRNMEVLPCEKIGMGAKYFLAICYIMNEEYKKASEILEDLTFFIENLGENDVEKIMVKAVYYYAAAMEKLKNHDKAMHYINLLFDDNITVCINESFKDREKILINHYGISEEDYVDNDDDFYLPYIKTLRLKQRDNVIDQLKNKEIFC